MSLIDKCRKSKMLPVKLSWPNISVWSVDWFFPLLLVILRTIPNHFIFLRSPPGRLSFWLRHLSWLWSDSVKLFAWSEMSKLSPLQCSKDEPNLFFSESKVLHRLLTECLSSDLMFNILMEKSISATCFNISILFRVEVCWTGVLSEFIAVFSFCTVLNVFYLLSLSGGNSFYCSLQSPTHYFDIKCPYIADICWYLLKYQVPFSCSECVFYCQIMNLPHKHWLNRDGRKEIKEKTREKPLKCHTWR